MTRATPRVMNELNEKIRKYLEVEDGEYVCWCLHENGTDFVVDCIGTLKNMNKTEPTEEEARDFSNDMLNWLNGKPYVRKASLMDGQYAVVVEQTMLEVMKDVVRKCGGELNDAMHKLVMRIFK